MTKHPSVFERLYAREMNFQVSCFWDGGYTFKLGDETNGFSYTEHFDKWADGLIWLEEMLAFHIEKDGANQDT